MRYLILTSFMVPLWLVPVAAQQPNARLVRAVDLIERNDATRLRRLLQEDSTLVRRTEAGILPHWNWTLLHKATADPASLEIVAVLVEAGADVNVKDNEGNTPLHFAMKRIGREKLHAADYHGIIRLLLEKKADVRASNNGGATPLHTAAAFRADPAGVELLIQAGAEVNRKAAADFGGWTALHGAAARNSADIVSMLLSHGADPTARDAKGLTALQVAEQGGFAAAAKVLRSVAATPASPAAAPATAATPAATPAAAPAASGSGMVQGRVLWNGQPVPGATVFVGDDPKPGSVRYGTVTTDDQGRFAIAGVPPGYKYVGVRGNQRVFWVSAGTPFTMTDSPFTRDFHLCKGFDLVSPAPDESVGARPVLRWDPYPDAVGYNVQVIAANNQLVFARGNKGPRVTATTVEVDVDLPPGTYNWSVRAENAAGQVIGCSFLPRRFTVR
jgi:ankyrin repeat protein